MKTSENLLSNDLQVDELVQKHLSETAKWARFLAIVGYVFSSLCGLAGIFGLFSSGTRETRRSYFETTARQDLSPVYSAILLIVMAVVWFLTSFYTFRFADKMKTAFISSDQFSFVDSFANLSRNYRLLGIVTIVYLALVALALVAGIMI